MSNLEEDTLVFFVTSFRLVRRRCRRIADEALSNLRRSAVSAEKNKEFIRKYVDTWNRGDLQGLCQFWSPDMIHHARELDHGFEGVKSIVRGFMQAFPDLNFQIEDIVAEGDRVVTRMTARATHLGDYMGVPRTGKKINCTVLGIARLANGRIAEHWGVTDELAMMQQIGLLPEEYLAAMS
jgi:C-1 hydroxylase